MNALKVFYQGWGERWLLGHLLQVDGARGRILFEYAPEAIKQGLELSPLHMPLPLPGAQPKAYEGSHFSMGLPGLLADALPDGWGMLLMDRALRRAGRDLQNVSVLERLALVGYSALGALCFEPAQDALSHIAGPLRSLRTLAMQVKTVLNDDDERTPTEQLQELMRLGGSPQGARPKVLLRVHASTGALQPEPLDLDRNEPPGDDGHGDAWLLKFPAQGEHPEVSAVEELYARLARLGGMDMPLTCYFDLGGKLSAFGAQRFDRARAFVPALGVRDVRVPIISLAALLEADYRLPAIDYETLLLATQRITGDQRETLKAFERCVFNVLLHNRDDHSKNFAFRLNAERRWQLSPAFDLTYSQGPGGQHSTSVAGEGAAPKRAQLLQVAQRGGLSIKQAEHCIDHWQSTLQALPLVADELPIQRKTLLQIERGINAIFY